MMGTKKLQQKVIPIPCAARQFHVPLKISPVSKFNFTEPTEVCCSLKSVVFLFIAQIMVVEVFDIEIWQWSAEVRNREKRICVLVLFFVTMGIVWRRAEAQEGTAETRFGSSSSIDHRFSNIAVLFEYEAIYISLFFIDVSEPNPMAHHPSKGIIYVNL